METIENIMIDEGYSDTVYLCTEGKRTWLYGRNIEDRPITKDEWEFLSVTLKAGGTQKEWAEILFFEEIRNNQETFEIMYPGLHFSLPRDVAAIIDNMIYNMGLSKFNSKKWPNFFTAIKERDWKLAAAHGRDSLWYFQVGHRSKRLMKSLENVKEY